MNQFRSKLKGLDGAIRTGAIRALNKSLTSAKSKLVKDLRTDTGLKTEDIKARVMALKASNKKLTVSLNMAVKIGVPLRRFDPRPKKVKAGKRTYEGVTVKIGQLGRQLAPGAFFMGRNSSFVIGRKLSYTNGVYLNKAAPRKPTVQLRSSVFVDSAQRRRDEAKRYLIARFEAISQHEIEFSLKQRLSGNK